MSNTYDFDSRFDALVDSILISNATDFQLNCPVFLSTSNVSVSQLAVFFWEVQHEFNVSLEISKICDEHSSILYIKDNIKKAVLEHYLC